jgi:hypothetical protein
LFSLKTYKGSSPAKQPTESQFSNMSSESWKDWVTEQRQEYSQRKKSAHLIRESESTSLELEKNWATPIVGDAHLASNPEAAQKRLAEGKATLSRQAEAKNWPTATTRDWKGCGNAITRKDGKHRIDNLEAVIKYGPQDQANPNTNGKNQESWSTPQARDWKGSEGRAYKGQTKDLPAQTESQGKLNPNWVEHLMGLPAGWTDLDSWETE